MSGHSLLYPMLVCWFSRFSGCRGLVALISLVIRGSIRALTKIRIFAGLHVALI